MCFSMGEISNIELYNQFIGIIENPGPQKLISKEHEPGLNVEPNFENKAIDELIETIDSLFGKKALNIENLNYALVTKKIYDLENHDVSERIYEIENYLKKKNQNNSIKVVKKLLRHADLALVQKRSLLDEITNLKDNLDKSRKENENLSNNLQKLKNQISAQQEIIDKQNKTIGEQSQTLGEKIKALDEQSKRLLPEFIGIMGVFATIIFAVFSGFNEVTTLGSSLSTSPISKILIYIGATFIVLIGLVFISYLALSRFFGVNLSSCSCELSSSCNHSFVDRHPAIILFILISLSFMALGAILVLYRDYLELEWGYMVQNHILYILVVLLLIAVLAPFFLFFRLKVK